MGTGRASATGRVSDSELAGKVAVVTGSSSGIGEQIARRLAALGASVVVNSSSSTADGERIAAELGERASYVQADISDEAQARRMIDEVVGRYGRLDVLVNNAGWTTRVDHRDLDALTDDIFRRTFDVNVWGTWAVTKAAIPHLARSDDASIVTITSIAGLRPIGSSLAYAMSKAALNHMTALLAKSYAPIRVNAVAPGLVKTPWTEQWDDLHEAMARRNPLKRAATPDDVAEAVLGLLRNRYVTGQIVVVDGGFTQVV
jgi:ketoreductase RED2